MEKGVGAGGESRENNDEEVRAERITLADASGQKKEGKSPKGPVTKKIPLWSKAIIARTRSGGMP